MGKEEEKFPDEALLFEKVHYRKNEITGILKREISRF